MNASLFHLEQTVESNECRVDRTVPEDQGELMNSAQNAAESAVEPHVLDWETFVAEFNIFQKKTAENMLHLSDTVYRAKNKLSNDDFLHFCQAVKLDKDK